MEIAKFVISRKKSISGMLVPFRIYINGQLAGTVKNGQTVTLEVPRAPVYILYESFSNTIAQVQKSDYSKAYIQIQMKKNTCVFLQDNKNTSSKVLPEPQFLSKIENAYSRGGKEKNLNNAEKVLLLCYTFWEEYLDGIDQVLYDEKCLEMLDAVKRIGAGSLVEICDKVMEELSEDFALPLQEEDEIMEEILEDVFAVVEDMERECRPSEEFYSAFVRYGIANHLL